MHPLLALATSMAIVAGLSLGKPLLIPIALAVVLSLLLAPLVRALVRLRLPRALAAPLVVLLFAGAIASLGLVVTRQTVTLVHELPRYRENIEDKLTSLQPISRVVERTRELVDELTHQGREERPTGSGEPVKVQVVDAGPDELSLAGSVLHFVADAVKTVAVALLLVMFFLVNQSDMVDRIIRLAGPGRVTVTTRTLYEAAYGVSRYLGTQALVNGGFGLVLGSGLLVLGVPNALLWGLLGSLLRFLPYVGPIVGCTLPVLLAFAVFEGWARPLATLGFIVLVELLLNNLIEPLVYGARTGLSPTAVILAAIFWGWLWGPLGLLLAVPLTVCLAALARCVPGLTFLTVALGSEAPIEPPVALYHRLLAGKLSEALEVIEETRGAEALEETYDRLLLPVLALTSADVERGALDTRQAASVIDSVRQLAQDADRERATALAEAGHAPALSVVCLPATDPADEVAAEMLARALAGGGYRAAAGTLGSLTAEKADLCAETAAEVACIVAVGPAHLMRLHYLHLKLRQRFPALRIVVVACWPEGEALEQVAAWVGSDGKDRVATSFRAALREVRVASQVVQRRGAA